MCCGWELALRSPMTNTTGHTDDVISHDSPEDIRSPNIPLSMELANGLATRAQIPSMRRRILIGSQSHNCLQRGYQSLRPGVKSINADQAMARHLSISRSTDAFMKWPSTSSNLVQILRSRIAMDVLRHTWPVHCSTMTYRWSSSECHLVCY